MSVAYSAYHGVYVRYNDSYNNYVIIVQGPPGPMGETGRKGPPGQPGKDGVPGSRGMDGRPVS